MTVAVCMPKGRPTTAYLPKFMLSMCAHTAVLTHPGAELAIVGAAAQGAKISCWWPQPKVYHTGTVSIRSTACVHPWLVQFNPLVMIQCLVIQKGLKELF